MVITAPGMPELRVSLRTPSGPTQKVKVWSDICDAVEITDNNCQQWFATFLNAPDVKLVRMADSFVRKTDPKFAPNGQTSFADGYPFLLASEGSLEDLNSKMDKPITMERFRPNIVVGNCAPFAEDAWKTIKLHSKEAVDIVMNLVKPCSRCGIPNIDPLTAQSHPAPTNAMNTYRTGAKLSLDPSWKSKVGHTHFLHARMCFC
ncbi:MOSC domain-containing protein [archaeon]|nr:MAG: MOSC domain-containing protein [archaeon]